MSASVTAIIAPGDVTPFEGKCWQVPLPQLPPGGFRLCPRYSPLRLLENGVPLGPGNTYRPIVIAEGGGRFIHWGRTLYFSTRDDGDPRTNGRTYTAHVSTPLDAGTLGQLQAVGAMARQGIRPPQNQLAELMSRAEVSVRAWIFQELGFALRDGGLNEDAVALLGCACRMDRGCHPALQATVDLAAARNDFAAIVDALRGVAATIDDDAALCDVLLYFHEAVYRDYETSAKSTFQDDPIVTPVARALARHRRPPPEPRRDGPLRVGYVLAGERSAHYSALPDIAVEMIAQHDPDLIDACAISLHRREDLVDLNPYFRQWEDRLSGVGRSLRFIPPLGASALDAALSLAERVARLDLDILVFSGLSHWHFLLAALRPARRIIGLGHGETELYTSRVLDLAIHTTFKPAMTGLCRSERMPPFVPDSRLVQAQAPADRATLGVPDTAVVLMSSARAVKFREPEFWRVMTATLQRRPQAWLVVVGPDSQALSEYVGAYGIPDEVARRTVALGWRGDHQAVLAAADIFVDTFPNGGLYALFEAMIQGVAGVTVEDDYLTPFVERTWRPAAEWLPANLFSVPNDENLLTDRLVRLIDNPEERRSLGRVGREVIATWRGSTRCVRRLEEIFLAPITPSPIPPDATVIGDRAPDGNR